MKYIKLFENFIEEEVNDDITIINDGDGTVTLMYNDDKIGRLKAQITELKLSSDIDFTKYYKVSYVEIDDKYKGNGYGTKLYKNLYNNAPSDIKAIISHESDRSNQNEVPKIYDKFYNYYEDGYYVIPINIQESILIDECVQGEDDEDIGNVFGNIHFNRIYLNNWLESNDINLNEIDTLPMPIGILKNINIDEEYRGKGHGDELLELFEDICASNLCKCIILISDMYESQLDGFNLDEWCIKNGYTEIYDTSSGKLFMKKL